MIWPRATEESLAGVDTSTLSTIASRFVDASRHARAAFSDDVPEQAKECGRRAAQRVAAKPDQVDRPAKRDVTEPQHAKLAGVRFGTNTHFRHDRDAEPGRDCTLY